MTISFVAIVGPGRGPTVIDLQGRDPNPTPTAFGERMQAKCAQMGWTTKMATGAAVVDEGTGQ